MSAQKRNAYLDIPLSSDSESRGYDSEQEAATDSRTAGLASHRAKRRKLPITPSDRDGGEQTEKELDEKDLIEPSQAEKTPPVHPPGISHNEAESHLIAATPPGGHTKQLASNPSVSLNKKKPTKPGVIYLSRIPPYMPPHVVRTHLSTHGPITNIFLTPEPPAQRARRLKHGGNRKRSYTEGWIEFSSRKHAQACADAINGQTVGGKKGGWYRDDVWNAKYLRGFSWGDLMEGVRREEREREERVRVGLARDKREREAFLREVEMSKIAKTRREKGKKEEKVKEKEGGLGPGDAGGKAKGDEVVRAARTEQRRFRQSEVKGKEKNSWEQPDETMRVLSKIF